MPPPASFLTVSAFPYSRVVTVAEFNAGTFGTAANEVWAKHVCTDDSVFGVVKVSGLTAVVVGYETDSLTVKRTATDKALWFTMTSGLNYWIKITKSGGGSIASNFTIAFEQAVLDPAPEAGDIIINDDTSGFEAVIMSAAGVIRGFKSDVPAGETGDSLPDGTQLWSDNFSIHGSQLSYHDPDGVFVSALDTSPSIGSTEPHIVAAGGKFYVVNRNGPDAGKVFTVTSGVVSALVSDMNILTNAVGISPDESFVYYIPDGGPNFNKIVKWDIGGSTSLGPIYSVSDPGSDTVYFGLTAENQQPGEILVQSDGTLVTYWQNDTQQKSVLVHLSAAGAVLHSYTFTWPGLQINHIAWAPGDPSYVRVWFYTSVGAATGKIREMNIATGAYTETPDMPMFDAGVSRGTSSTPFSVSNSCTMITAKRSEAQDAETDTGTGDGSGGTSTIPTCCDEGGPPGGGDTGLNPDPVGTLPPWMASCTGGGLVDGVADLADGESWL